MQIKTYKAEAMKDVLAQIRAELGPDAVILSTREVRDESFGALARPMVEVTAAVDFGERRLAEPVAASLALWPANPLSLGEFLFVGEVVLLVWLIGWGGRDLRSIPARRMVASA